MAIAYRDPLEQLQRELDRMLESAFGSVGASAAGVYPPVNVFDAGEEYVIKAELPGVDPGKVEVNVEGDQLTIEGRIKPEDYEGLKPLHVEYGVGGFWRRFTVGEAIDLEGIKAQIKGGVLALHLPKAERARARRITVQAS